MTEGARKRGRAVWGGLTLYMGLFFGSAASLVVRFVLSGSVERQQIKWLAIAAVVIPVWFLTEAPIEAVAPNVFRVVDALIFSAMVPLATGKAILKCRLYDIDIIINRTLVYGTLTAILAGVYFGSVTATQALFSILTDQQELPQLVVVTSTLLIAALFNPLRRRIQSFIDRRFYRSKYCPEDARRVLDEAPG